MSILLLGSHQANIVFEHKPLRGSGFTTFLLHDTIRPWRIVILIVKNDFFFFMYRHRSSSLNHYFIRWNGLRNWWAGRLGKFSVININPNNNVSRAKWRVVYCKLTLLFGNVYQSGYRSCSLLKDTLPV